MMPEQMIERNTLVRKGSRIGLSIRMPWYRAALPLSCVAGVQWTVDGEPVPPESITWTVDGATSRLDELPDQHDKWWYVLDSAELEGAMPALAEDAEHTVEVVLTLFIPYITTDFGVLSIAEKDTKTMPMRVIR